MGLHLYNTLIVIYQCTVHAEATGKLEISNLYIESLSVRIPTKVALFYM